MKQDIYVMNVQNYFLIVGSFKNKFHSVNTLRSEQITLLKINIIMTAKNTTAKPTILSNGKLKYIDLNEDFTEPQNLSDFEKNDLYDSINISKAILIPKTTSAQRHLKFDCNSPDFISSSYKIFLDENGTAEGFIYYPPNSGFETDKFKGTFKFIKKNNIKIWGQLFEKKNNNIRYYLLIEF